MTNIAAEPAVTTIVRFHDIRQAHLLQEAVLSACMQEGVSVHVRVMAQRLAAADLAALEHRLAPYRELLDGELKILNVTDGVGDMRTHLLNAGLKKTETRYVAILDCDDVLYPRAYRTLIGALQVSSDAVVAFGGIVWAECEDVGTGPYVCSKTLTLRHGSRYDLFVDNFCPIHSFVVDQDRCTADALKFDESLPMLEDYDFLLRLCASHAADFSKIRIPVGEYRRRPNDTIRAQDAIAFTPGLSNPLDAARTHIKALKERLRTQVPLSDFERLNAHWLGQPASAPTMSELADQVAAAGRDAAQQGMAARVLVRSLLEESRPNWPYGIVEEVRADGPDPFVSGWIIKCPNTEFNGTIFALMSDGALRASTVEIERPDIEREFGVMRAGFSIRLSGAVNNQVLVFVVYEGKVFRISSLEEFAPEQKADPMGI